jgi:HlyD family secretion protein
LSTPRFGPALQTGVGSTRIVKADWTVQNIVFYTLVDAMTDAPAAASALSKLKIDRGAPGSKKKETRFLPVVLALLVAAGGAAAYYYMPRTADVTTTSVIMSTPSQQFVQLTASGYVVAQRRSAVASKATGRLIELNVREGSQVKKGDLIARLDSSDVRATILAAEAAVHQAEANVQQLNVQLIQARADLARQRSLEAQGFVSTQMVETALSKNKIAFSNHAAAKAALEQTQAQLKAQKVAQEYTEIRAPFDGVVLVKNANVGDIITPMSSAAGAQGAVVTMADMTTLEVEADVSEGNLSKIKVGQPVEVTLDGLPGVRFKAHVAGIVPTVDRAKATVMTKIRFDDLDPRILPEMSAKVSFLSQEITPEDQVAVMAVAANAVAQRKGGAMVYRVKAADANATAATVEEIPVKALRKLGELQEINGPLKAGDKIVVAPTEKLQAGSRVNVVTP